MFPGKKTSSVLMMMMMIMIMIIIIIGTDTIYLNHGSQSLLKLNTAFDQVIPAINGVSIAVQEDIV